MSRTERRPRTGLRLLVGGVGPPRWFVHACWTDRDRQSVRADCRRAVQEHRATGVVDVVPDTYGHRHNAQWHWW